MPPVSKPPALRRGHRSSAPRRVLQEVRNPKIPKLPPYCDWHPAVLDFWDSVWKSPMPQEWTESDRHNVLLAARAMLGAWDPEVRTTARSAAMAECRLILRECGLTPMARRSLQIEIARAEDATERRQAKKGRVPVVDPRRGMHAV
jgi:phage terminase small subunit